MCVCVRVSEKKNKKIVDLVKANVAIYVKVLMLCVLCLFGGLDEKKKLLETP